MLGLETVKLLILPILFIHFVQEWLEELRSGYWGLMGSPLLDRSKFLSNQKFVCRLFKVKVSLSL